MGAPGLYSAILQRKQLSYFQFYFYENKNNLVREDQFPKGRENNFDIVATKWIHSA